MSISPDEVLNVSSLNYYLHSLLSQNIQRIWVRGETSNVATSRSGHTYFKLKDPFSAIDCILTHQNLQKNPTVQNNMNALICAWVKIYRPTGNLQLEVEKVILEDKGAMGASLEALKAKLFDRGVFNPEHKKKLPAWVLHLGVVTSKDGDAIEDIRKTIQAQDSRIQLHIYHSNVQGENALNSLPKAIKQADQDGLDAIVIARGGGSAEDLMAFSSEVVVMAVFRAKTPIISGIGHEMDYTLCDATVDYKAATPSLAAVYIAKNNQNTQERFYRANALFLEHSKQCIEHSQRVFLNVKQRFLPPQFVSYQNQVNALTHQLQQRIKNYLHKTFYSLKNTQHHVYLGSPQQKINRAKNVLQSHTQSMHYCVQNIILNRAQTHQTRCMGILHNMNGYLSQHRNQLLLIQQKVQLGNPNHIIQKGYAVLKDLDTQKILSHHTFKNNDWLEIQTNKQLLTAQITRVKKNS